MVTSLPSTMRAVEGPAAGPVSSLKVVTTRSVPRASAGLPDVPAVVVKVSHAALNPVDWKMMEFGILIEKWPYALGCDISGEVVEASDGTGFQPGDKVFAFTLLGEGVQGAAFAEYTRVPASLVGRVPPSVSMEAACTVGLSSLTATLGIFQELGLPLKAPEPKGSVPVLVYGASSSTGAFVVSVLKNCGYRAVAVASSAHHAWLTDIVGAAQVVDYRDSGWMDAIAGEAGNQGMKYAIDCIAKDDGKDWTASLGVEEEKTKLTGTLGMCDEVLKKCGSEVGGVIASVDPFVKGIGKRKVVPISTILSTPEQFSGAQKYVALAEKLLEESKLITMPTEVLGGLECVGDGLQMLKDGKVSRKKLVVKV